MTFMPIMTPAITLLTVTDVITAMKTVATRNNLISRTSVNLGFETSASVIFASGVSSTYATSTSVAGTLSYPTALSLQSRWTTVLTLNEGATPGTTVVNANSGAYSATDESILYSNASGSVAGFKLCLFQIPIGFGNLSSIATTFNKASSTSVKNSQQVYVLPGKWGSVSNSYVGGAPAASISVAQNDIVFGYGIVGVVDSSIPALVLSGTSTKTRIIETSSTYGSDSGQLALFVADSAGTFTCDAGSQTTTTGGGGHGGGTVTTTTYYDSFVQSLRFVQA